MLSEEIWNIHAWGLKPPYLGFRPTRIWPGSLKTFICTNMEPVKRGPTSGHALSRPEI